MFLYYSILIVLFISIPSNCINVLVFSPAWAVSHTNFLARLADTLTEVGHNVTFLVPIGNERYRNQLGVKLTKDVVIVERDEQMKREEIQVDEDLDRLWTLDPHATNFDEMFSYLNRISLSYCAYFMRNKQVFQLMEEKKFDVAIMEPISICGLGIFEKLGIKNTILASSLSSYGSVVVHSGEPEELSYVPASYSPTTDQMTIMERYKNFINSWNARKNNEKMFDKETLIYRRHLGEDVADWRDLMAKASLMFTNSNPFLDFPRPALQKTIHIGGISVDMKKIKKEKLGSNWEEILSKRPKTMLISFGSMVKSSKMPNEWRKNILKSDKIRTKFAFLTHGGLGSTMELAYCGKPSVMVPITFDQYRNAHMMERHKTSIRIWKTDLENYEIVKSAVHSILHDPKFTENARKLAELLENQPQKPKEQVVKYREFLAKHGPFPQMDPFGRHLNYFQKTFLDVFGIFAIGLFGITVFIWKFLSVFVRKSINKLV